MGEFWIRTWTGIDENRGANSDITIIDDDSSRRRREATTVLENGSGLISGQSRASSISSVGANGDHCHRGIGNDDNGEKQPQQQQPREGDALNVLKVGIQLALDERDLLLRQYERLLEAVQRQQQQQQRLRLRNEIQRRATMRMETTTLTMRRGGAGGGANGEDAINGEPSSSTTSPVASSSMDRNNRLLFNKHDLVVESVAMSSPKLNNREAEVNSRHLGGVAGLEASKPIPSPKFNACFNLAEMFVEPVDDEGSEVATTWEYKTATLSRVPGYGFGIAVSGGRDNPHFKSGDPSIVVSDVLRAGPAWGMLQINDRIISANGIGLEHADYSTAVQIMKENEQLNLVVKRRVPLPTPEFEQRNLKFTLTKSRRKDDFGIVLGCKFYIKSITNKKLAEKEPGLKPGDVVLKINAQDCEELTLSDARKMLEKSKERLSLVVQRDVPRGTTWKWPSQATLYERLGPGDTPRQSPIPRSSPMVGSRYSDGEPVRLNNTLRFSGRMGRLTSSEYNASPKRHSYGSQPPSRSRTPSQSVYDDYSNFSPRGSLPHTPPPRTTTPAGDESSHLSLGGGPPGESPITHKPPLPSPQPEPRFITFTKESGSVGVRVIGGNEVGIFVSAVQAGSPAAAKGVRPGDKILRVNNKDMRGVTREEAVLFLLGLQDQVDLVVQYRKDEYERIRTQNLGDNFHVRTHFDYEKPESGELGFRKGDIFQISDTLFGGTVGAWQALRVSSPSATEKASTESPQAKGVIPNATRAEQLLNAEVARSSRSTSTESRTGSLLRKKVTLTRRSKSLTKGHWDEVVFAHGTVHFPAYERVKLKHPGFLRPVVLFGALSDVAREQLLQDFPLRFASPQNDLTMSTSMSKDAAADPASGVIRLSAIREVMNKNKHCLLDVTPNSVEKLQYAQYCPIVIYISVDSRSRLRDLRKKHSKAAASKNSRKLQEQASKIQKMYSYLFTAVLDATHEDHWFEALRELISHLQERRVWMAESRPAELLDDDFLFPMANSRGSGNYAGDSDVDSLRGDGEYGTTGPCDPRINESMDSGGYTSSHVTQASLELSSHLAHTIGPSSSGWRPAPDGADIYSNRDVFIDHIATLRRPVGDARGKPRPPPRYAQYPPIPPKPTVSSPSSSTAPPLPPPAQAAARALMRANSTCGGNGNGSDTSTLSSSTTPSNVATVAPTTIGPPSVHQTMASTTSRSEPNGSSTSAVSNLHASNAPSSAAGSAYQPPHSILSGRNGRHLSEPGFYDVKQILADQNEDYVNRSAAAAMFERSCYVNGSRSPSYFEPGPGPRFTAGDTVSYTQQPYSPLTTPRSAGLPNGGSNGPISVFSNPIGPVSIINRSYDQQPKPMFNNSAYNLPPAPGARASPISRTASLSTGTPPPLPGYGSRPFVTQQPPPAGVDYHRRAQPHGPIRSPLPPPAPAPRSPHPHSPRLLAAAGNLMPHAAVAPIRFMDDETTYASLPTIPINGDGDGQQKAKENGQGERLNGDLSTNGHGSRPNSAARPLDNRNSHSPRKLDNNYNEKSPGLNGLNKNDQQNGSAFELYRKENGANGGLNGTNGDLSDGSQCSDPHDGHAILAHVSATIGPEGGTLTSDTTGVCITVPPGALSTTQEMFFKVFRDASMSPPVDTTKGEALLSPLLMCGPPGLRFVKPVELKLPHCASGVNPEQWSFALKSASATRDGLPSWRQVALTDIRNTQNGQINEKFVTIMIDHF